MSATVRRLIVAWLPVLLIEAVVLFLSSRPYLALPRVFPNVDKVAHFGEYAALGALFYRALRLSGGERAESVGWTIFVISGLGAGDEVLQSRVPGRESSARDWLADLLGGSMGAMLARFIEPKIAWAFRAPRGGQPDEASARRAAGGPGKEG